MRRIITALILIPLVLLLVFKAPLWAIALVTCLVALLATHEYLHIVEHYGVKSFRQLTYGLTVLLFSSVILPVSQFSNPTGNLLGILFAPLILISAIPFVFLVASMTRSSLRESLPAAAYSQFGILYIALSLALFVWIRTYQDGVFWILVLFATVWAGDSVAMYVGKGLGKHQLAPRISPNKTWEGSAGSVFGSIAASFAVLHFRDAILAHSRFIYSETDLPISAPHILNFCAIVIVLNIAGQLGDLVESVMKRGADIKDSGSLLPGHGGILDRIDALLFAAPVLWYYLIITRV
jgi:phosphatidate cytidylyltransferase